MCTLVCTGPYLGHAQIVFEDATRDALKGSYSGPTAGASWGDMNGDGWPDLWVGNHRFNTTAPTLLINNGDGTFHDGSAAISAPIDADMHGAAWADFDADGDQDIVVLSGGGGGDGSSPNLLFINDAGRLTDAAAELGVSWSKGRGRTPLWLDINNDARLDLVLTNMPRPDGADPTRILIQSKHGFSPLDAPLKFAPEGRNWLEGALFTLRNALNYRGREGFGALRVLDVFAQLGDVDADGVIDLVAYGDPTRVYSLAGPSPASRADIYFPGHKQIADIAIEDFNGDLQPDMYVARLREGAPNVAQISPNIITAHLRKAAPAQLDELEIVAKSRLRVEIIDLYEITAKLPPVFIGRDRISPTTLAFELDPNDASFNGPITHTDDTAEVLIAKNSTNGWLISNWAGRINIKIEALDAPITEFHAVGFTPHKGDIPDQLLIAQDGKFESTRVVGENDIRTNCSSVVAADFDNDMDVDVYLACSEPSRNAANVLLENLGQGRFEQVTMAGGAAGSHLGRSESVVTADYDGDGFVDIFLTNGRGAMPFSDDGPYQLFRNKGNDNHWLEIDLVGTHSNREGIGAIAQVFAGGKGQIRHQAGGIHNFSQNHTRLHFGLAANTRVDKIIISWPSGTRQILRNIKADQLIKITEHTTL